MEYIDYDKLKYDLMDYFGSAMPILPMAVMDLVEVEHASPQKLIQIARDNGFDLENYIIKYKKYKYM